MPSLTHYTTALFLLAPTAISAARFSNSTGNTIVRDVVIVGGGASGAHAAVKLRDAGRSVVVVEKQGQLVCIFPWTMELECAD